MRKITIVNSTSWGGIPYEVDFVVDGIDVHYVSDKFDPKADFACDVGTPFQGMSSRYPAEKRIYIPTEPGPILGMNDALAARIADYYKGLILAWHKPLLKYPQNVKFANILCWVRDGWSIKDKTFGISGFVSSKNRSDLPGYGVRRRVLENEHKFEIPSMVWNFRHKWQGKPHGYPFHPRVAGMKQMYHFAIENCQEEGYFTEKVMDCFRTYSVPLYWGDPTICSKFDSKGIIILDPANIVKQVNSLTPKDYEERIPALKRNFEYAGKYLDARERVISVIMKNKGLV